MNDSPEILQRFFGFFPDFQSPLADFDRESSRILKNPQESSRILKNLQESSRILVKRKQKKRNEGKKKLLLFPMLHLEGEEPGGGGNLNIQQFQFYGSNLERRSRRRRRRRRRRRKRRKRPKEGGARGPHGEEEVSFRGFKLSQKIV